MNSEESKKPLVHLKQASDPIQSNLQLESYCRQSGADDTMVLETAKEWYKNRIGGSEFKRFHWWEAVRHQHT
jgi:hypothetical protein